MPFLESCPVHIDIKLKKKLATGFDWLTAYLEVICISSHEGSALVVLTIDETSHHSVSVVGHWCRWCQVGKGEDSGKFHFFVVCDTVVYWVALAVVVSIALSLLHLGHIRHIIYVLTRGRTCPLQWKGSPPNCCGGAPLVPKRKLSPK